MEYGMSCRYEFTPCGHPSIFCRYNPTTCPPRKAVVSVLICMRVQPLTGYAEGIGATANVENRGVLE